MDELLGISPAINRVRVEIERSAPTHANVLIIGETGVGKEVVARLLHRHSRRAEHALIAVDCGTLTDELAAGELFGARRGAYTGATHDREGLLASAHQGTLFLDEIGNLSHRVQGMLLRALQEQRVRRLGDAKDEAIDLRVLSATNRSLDQSFRRDLLYRLNTLTIPIPPLRERLSDIPLLAEYQLGVLNQRYGRNVAIAPAALTLLQTRSFPGNVRELEHLIHRAYIQAHDTIQPLHVEPTTDLGIAPPVVCQNFWEDLAQPYTQRCITRQQLETAIRNGLESTKGNYRRLATHFGLAPGEYKRFMDFLRRHHCNVDFRSYRGQP